MIANNRFPICSVMLKREPLDEWQWQNLNPRNSLFGEPDVIYIGFNALEFDRLEAFRNTKPEWQIEAPMCEWPPVWGTCKMQEELVKLGAPPQRAYRDGFAHNNCGRRCVRAGITHFVHLYNTDPEAYLEWEREELATQRELASRDISTSYSSVLKDRRGGVTKSMTFAELRQRILADDKSLPKDEWGGCGCGVTSDGDSSPAIYGGVSSPLTGVEG